MDLDFPLRLSELTRRQLVEQNSLNFTQYLSCLAHTNGYGKEAAELFITRFAGSPGASSLKKMLDTTGPVDLVMKAVIAPGTTTDSAWAKPLVPTTTWANGFLQIAHSKSVLGRLTGAQQIPFNCKVPYETAAANFAWVSEAAMTPTSKLAFSDGLTLPPTKILGIVVVTEEFAQLASGGVATAMQSTLVGALNAALDKAFLDPASTAIAGQRPGSITSTAGAPLVGTADVVASVKALIAAFFSARPGAEAPVLIANGNYAAAIRGQVPGFGLEVIASEAALNNIILVDPAAVFYADGGLETTYSREAALEMNDAPTTPPTAATVYTSLWQSNLVGYKLLRFIGFGAAPTAVKYSTMP